MIRKRQIDDRRDQVRDEGGRLAPVLDQHRLVPGHGPG
jgi:hypothetical protein